MPVDPSWRLSYRGRVKARFDRDTALEDIDHVLGFATTPDDDGSGTTAFVTRAFSCIQRNAPADSIYFLDATKAVRDEEVGSYILEKRLLGLLRGLRADIDQRKMERFEELVHGDLFSDFLDQAEYLLSEGSAYRRAAAILGGGTLEEHLRKLARKHAIDIVDPKDRPKKAGGINDELLTGKAYGKTDHALVGAWLKLRNDAAHGQPDFEEHHSADKVASMLHGVRELIARLPA